MIQASPSFRPGTLLVLMLISIPFGCASLSAQFEIAALFNMGMARISGGLRMEWFGYSGIHYQVQVSDDLKEWADHGPAQQGADASLLHEESLAIGEPRFFRIQYGW